MASTCSTHPTSPGSPRTTPRASARPTPLLSNLPTAWQAFANEFGLTYRDVIGLMSFEPVADLNAETLVVFVNQLEAALRVDDWPLSEALLCMLVRSDLRPVFDAACDCGLGWVAMVAARKDKIGRHNGGGNSDAGMTARLGYVLAVQLERMAGVATQAEVQRQRKAGKRKRAVADDDEDDRRW